MTELHARGKVAGDAKTDGGGGGKAAPGGGEDAGGREPPRPCAAAAAERCKEQYDLPIDKGWAWVVAVSTSLVFALCGGALRAHGMIYVEVMQQYKSPPTETYWIFGLGSAIAHGIAPVPGYFIQRFNHRVVLIGGSLLMTLGIAISAYMPDHRYMFFSFSVIYGSGLCCTLLTAFVAVGPYFNRLRTLATGIASAGSGVGTVVMSFALRFLFDELPFSGAMLLYSGILLHIVVLASLQRPITYYMHSAIRAQQPPRVPSAAGAGTKGPVNGDYSNVPLVAHVSDSRTGTKEANATGDAKLFHSLSTISPVPSDQSDVGRRHRTNSEPSMAKVKANAPLFTTADIIHASAHSLPPLVENDGKVKTEPANAAKSSSRRQVYMRILKSAVFWCIGLSIFCYAQAFSLSYSIVPPYAASIGISKATVAWLIAAGGFSEVVGRLTNGYLSDLKKLSPTVHYCLLPLLPAFTAFLCPMIGGSVGIGFFLVTTGLLGSSMFPFQTAVLREQLGDESVTPGLSMLFLFQTVGYITAALMTSILYDLTHAWGDIFYYVSAVMFMASFCAAILSFRKLYNRCKTPKTDGDGGIVEEAKDAMLGTKKVSGNSYHESRIERVRHAWHDFWHMHSHGHPHVPNCIHFKWHPRTHHNSLHN